MSKKISRRDFFRTAGASAFTLGALAAAGTGCEPIEPDDKTENVVNTACDICMVRCAMKVHVDSDGKAVFVEGNPADPFNKGKLCPKGKSSLGFLYNDDRLLYPLKRTNTAAKGFGVDPQWEQITWDEAYSAIIEKIKESTNDYENGEQFSIISHGEYGHCKRLLSALGSPNLVTHYDTCFSGSFIARKAITGGTCWTNLAGATYILSFGWDQPDRCKDTPTVQFAEALSNGCKVVCFNPFQGTVGAKADKWIPIKPGTDLAVMLALINIIVSNKLYNTTALAKTNFSDYEAEITSNFSPYTAKWAEGISGVPAATIDEIARDFAAADNAIVPVHKRDGATGPSYSNSFHAAHAAYFLNALVGAIDRDGGDASLCFGWKPKAPLEYEENPPTGYNDLITEKGSIDGKHAFPLVQQLIEDRGIFANVAQRILDKDPNELKMAMFRRYGILSFPNPKKMAQALATLDYVVFMDTMPKEIMWFADLVLPEGSFFEGSGISYRKYCTPGYKMVMSKNKVASPLGESKSWGSVILEIGKKLDEDRGTQYFKLKDGDWVTKTDEKESMANNIKEGLTVDDILNAENGVYIKEQSPYSSKSEYSTASGKIEIYCTKMEDNGYDPLPSWLPKAVEPDSTYPLYLLIRRWAGLKHSAPLSSSNPYALDAYPYPVALMHPTTGALYGISDGDDVWIESTNGKMKAVAKLSERLRKDCLLTNHNYGHTVSELTYQFEDQGDGELIVDREESDLIALKDWSSNARMLEVCVKVYKV